MPTPQVTELHHGPNARFQSGNRVYRIVVLGQGGVGKSALTLQFVSHTFLEDHDPTIEDAYQKQVVIDNHPGIMDVLDTAGQDEFTAMREQYMRGGEGFILIYSITEKRSYDELYRFKEMIDRVRNYESVPIVIAGNKSDLGQRRQVSVREGEAMAREFNCPFFETSAALRHNVEEVFSEVVRCIRKKENEDYMAKKRSEGGAGERAGRGLSSLFCCSASSTLS